MTLAAAANQVQQPRPGAINESKDLIALWPRIQVAAAGRPIVVYGISLGGAATLLAGHQLEGVSGLIIESSYAVLPSCPVCAPCLRQFAGQVNRWP